MANGLPEPIRPYLRDSFFYCDVPDFPLKTYNKIRNAAATLYRSGAMRLFTMPEDFIWPEVIRCSSGRSFGLVTAAFFAIMALVMFRLKFI